ncbi:MAG: radical SAM protein [Candidatus Riflebacteria bacterium]|nr:radical SAM protein [Candidatus Riflebacteria bacterium]
MKHVLIYNMSGELDDISHLFPNERLGKMAAIAIKCGLKAEIADRANFFDLRRFGKEYLTNLGSLAFDDSNPAHEEQVVREAQAVIGTGCDIMLLNLWHGTGFKFSIDLARKIKNINPQIRIFGIGQKVDWFKEHILTLSENSLDGLFTGLGYDAAKALFVGQDISTIPGMVYRKGSQIFENERIIINPDDFPHAEYCPSVYSSISRKIPIYSLTLSNQACPNSCTFCVRTENYGVKNISRNINSVFSEMQALYSSGARNFRFEDSTPPVGALTKISQMIVDSEMSGKIHFTAFSRVDQNSSENFNMLHEAGCVALFFGVESLDPETLVKINKGFNVETVQKTIKMAHEAGIKTVASFIVPIPGDTQASIEKTFAGIREMRESLDSVISLPAAVYPPTVWGKNPAKYGIELDPDYLTRFVAYPIRYLIPLKLWPKPPFRYPLFGKPASDIDHALILSIGADFHKRIREELSIPSLSDYYYLVSIMMKRNPVELTRCIVKGMIDRDYESIEHLLTT